MRNLALKRAILVEPVTGIEPAPPAWEAGVLPLNYTGIACMQAQETRLALQKISQHMGLENSAQQPQQLLCTILKTAG